jgi:prefoldin subunit 5
MKRAIKRLNKAIEEIEQMRKETNDRERIKHLNTHIENIKEQIEWFQKKSQRRG